MAGNHHLQEANDGECTPGNSQPPVHRAASSVRYRVRLASFFDVPRSPKMAQLRSADSNARDTLREAVTTDPRHLFPTPQKQVAVDGDPIDREIGVSLSRRWPTLVGSCLLSAPHCFTVSPVIHNPLIRRRLRIRNHSRVSQCTWPRTGRFTREKCFSLWSWDEFPQQRLVHHLGTACMVKVCVCCRPRRAHGQSERHSLAPLSTLPPSETANPWRRTEHSLLRAPSTHSNVNGRCGRARPRHTVR